MSRPHWRVVQRFNSVLAEQAGGERGVAVEDRKRTTSLERSVDEGGDSTFQMTETVVGSWTSPQQGVKKQITSSASGPALSLSWHSNRKKKRLCRCAAWQALTFVHCSFKDFIYEFAFLFFFFFKSSKRSSPQLLFTFGENSKPAYGYDQDWRSYFFARLEHCSFSPPTSLLVCSSECRTQWDACLASYLLFTLLLYSTQQKCGDHQHQPR